MLNVSEISKTYGNHVLFNDVSFAVNPGEKVGLIGRNGYGKTTLFKIILGEVEADAGSILKAKDYRIGHLQQTTDFIKNTALEESYTGLDPAALDQHWKAKKILVGLGFDEEKLNLNPYELSEGYKLRLKLAKLIVSEPNLLLLDEPNNYLDLVAIRWLERFLNQWRGEMILITHDRDFMDSVTTHTMLIHRSKVRKQKGTTEKLYAQIAQEEEIHEKTRLNDEKKQKKTEDFIRKFRAKARLAGAVQSRLKSIDKTSTKEKLAKIEKLEFSFKERVFNSSTMMQIKNVDFAYAGSQNLISDLSFEIEKNDRIFVIGKNGKGKSTLLKLLASELEPSAGHVKLHKNASLGYFAQPNISGLYDNKNIVEEIICTKSGCTNQEARNICGTLMFSGDDAEKKIKVLSGGEKCRVLLAKLLVSPSNLLLLDEPSNHLDLESCDALAEALTKFNGAVVMVTHNEMFLRTLAKRLIVLDGDRVYMFNGGYQDFLEKIGWSEEPKDTEKDSKITTNTVAKKDIKKQQAQIRQKRHKILKPIEEKIKAAEDNIEKLELENEQNNNDLVHASEIGDSVAIAEISKHNYMVQLKIDELYELLDKLYEEHRTHAEEFKKQLEEIS